MNTERNNLTSQLHINIDIMYDLVEECLEDLKNREDL